MTVYRIMMASGAIYRVETNNSPSQSIEHGYPFHAFKAGTEEPIVLNPQLIEAFEVVPAIEEVL